MAKTKSRKRKSRKRKSRKRKSRKLKKSVNRLKSKGLSNMSICSLKSNGLSSMSISGMSISAEPIDYLKIPYFPICEKNLKEFSRLSAHPTDCIINALEIINAIDKQSAGIMRIIIEPDVTGITSEIIQSIFSFLYTTNIWHFKEYDNYFKFENRIVNDTFPLEHVIFCGITLYNGLNHTFLIGRDIIGNYFIIDGQIPNMICNLNYDINCYNNLKNCRKWYVLEFM